MLPGPYVYIICTYILYVRIYYMCVYIICTYILYVRIYYVRISYMYGYIICAYILYVRIYYMCVYIICAYILYVRIYYMYVYYMYIICAYHLLRIKQAPPILALQLKRFKFDESLQMFRKLPYRVAFPTELRLVNTVQEDEDFFDLYAVVVHVGSSPSHGHYYSVVRSFDQWFIFDDNRITPLDVRELQSFFGGSAYQQSHTADTAYLLFYESRRASQLRRGNSPAPPRHTPHAPAQHTNPFSPPETPAGPQSQTPVPE
ncbi:putative Ubiquitin carboxyl-terminal hydrolase [Paratrimastix pyriformis]|uniref:ubiquitinyl hydrolase 1 n=1 Tax=Paratrimastix pyriformis TaxID=342808 RepID=A0ABQ8UDX9_9EUKA|nr:putative Ubiquitin carboxyl-terminal hydrolase [Paratrimastix pyriformis]